jgi:hypothetical protein
MQAAVGRPIHLVGFAAAAFTGGQSRRKLGTATPGCPQGAPRYSVNCFSKNPKVWREHHVRSAQLLSAYSRRMACSSRPQPPATSAFMRRTGLHDPVVLALPPANRGIRRRCGDQIAVWLNGLEGCAYGLSTNATETTMQERLLRFIGCALILVSTLPLVGTAWGDTRTHNGATFNPARSSAAVRTRSAVDKNDRVVAGLESIAGLPEPRSIVLLGTALLVASGIARRRVMRSGRAPKE